MYHTKKRNNHYNICNDVLKNNKLLNNNISYCVSGLTTTPHILRQNMALFFFICNMNTGDLFTDV